MQTMDSVKNKIKSTAIWRLFSFDRERLLRFLDDNQIDFKRALYNKFKWSNILYDLRYKDFFQCRCDSLSYGEIKEIVPWKEQKALWRRVNSSHAHDILCDKYRSYELFADLYRRDVALVTADGNVVGGGNFLEKHARFIIN